MSGKITVESLQKEIEEMKEKQALQERNENMFRENGFGLGGSVTSINIGKPKPVVKKDGDKDIPVLDESGNPTFYDPRYYMKVAFMGGEETFACSAEQVQNIQEGMRVHVYGRLGRWGLTPVIVTVLD